MALSFHTEVNALANVGICSFSDVAAHLLSPAEGTGNQGPVAPSALGEESLLWPSGRRELRSINAQGKGDSSLSVLSLRTETCAVCSAQDGERTSLLGKPGSQSSN